MVAEFCQKIWLIYNGYQFYDLVEKAGKQIDSHV